MLKSILTQILNRKRSNAWITVELLLVFILVWYMTDYFFVLNCNYHIPDYRNTDHAWQISLGEYLESYSQYRAEENTGEAREANYARILRTLQDYPGVEAVSVSFSGSYPGSSSFEGCTFLSVDDSTRYANVQRITFNSQGDFFRVFEYSTEAGKQPVSAQDFDWTQPNGIVISRSMADALFPDSPATGKEVYRSNDVNRRYTVLGVVDNIKRFDYGRPQGAIYEALRLDSTNVRHARISIRANASIGEAAFGDNFKAEMTKRLQVGNFYLKSVVPYRKIVAKINADFGVDNAVRIRTYLMIFFLLNILLCVMGTFWYRISLRRSETGLRKVLGSSQKGIRNLFFTEGLCLLTIAALPAIFIEFQFVHTGLIDTLGQEGDNIGMYFPDRTALRFLVTNAITWVVMSAVIITAIWLPSRKAAAMPAAEALHYE
jgi:hypothetical protein